MTAQSTGARCVLLRDPRGRRPWRLDFVFFPGIMSASPDAGCNVSKVMSSRFGALARDHVITREAGALPDATFGTGRVLLARHLSNYRKSGIKRGENHQDTSAWSERMTCGVPILL